jgi:hypothetical protein
MSAYMLVGFYEGVKIKQIEDVVSRSNILLLFYSLFITKQL